MKVMRLLTISLALIVLATSCQQATSTAKAPSVIDKTYAVYNFTDAVTGAKIDLATGDTATIQYKASGAKPVTLSGTENDNGWIDFANDQVIVYNFEKNDNFILTVTKTGYKPFEGRAKFPSAKNIKNYVATKDDSPDVVLYDSVLYPSTIPFSTQALTFTVRNANTKAVITSGSYSVFLATSISNTDTGMGIASGIVYNDATTLLPQYIPSSTSLNPLGVSYQGYTLSGTVSATGTITIPAGALFSGQGYTVAVKGVSGYAVNTKDFIADGSTSANDFFVNLIPLSGSAAESTSLLNVIATNNMNSTAQLTKNVRSISLTFDKPIDVTYTNLLGQRLSNLVSVTTSNTDADANGTSLGVTTLPAVGALPTGLSVSVSGSTLTIALTATDTDLTTGVGGTLDTDDALTWNLSNVFSNISVRATDATNTTSWYTLTGGFTPVSTKVVNVNTGASVTISSMASIFVR